MISKIDVYPNALSSLETNVVTYRYSSVVSASVGGTVYQVVSLLDENSYIVLAIRALPSTTWTTYLYNGVANSPALQAGADFHNVPNIGIDSNGYLHLAYDVHVNPLKYRMSDAALSSWTGGLTDPLSMLGTNETEVTYPAFFTDPNGVLYFMFRDGDSSAGDYYMYTYNAGTTSWAAAAGTGTGGIFMQGKPDGEGPYTWGLPAFDSDFGSGGYMHVGYNWRTDYAATTNHDCGYVKWDGTNWYQADGTAQTIPITLANDDIFDAVSTSSGLTNQNNVDCDSSGRPHLVYLKDDATGNGQVYHAIFDAGWTITAVTNTVSGSIGAWPWPIARPDIVIDRATNTAYIAYRDDGEGAGVRIATSGANDFTTWTTERIYHQDVGRWEPSHDPYQWRVNGELHLFYSKGVGV